MHHPRHTNRRDTARDNGSDRMRVLVHKRRGDQVVLGAIQERSPGGFKVSLSAAGLETFLQRRSTNIQPRIIAEALRQATILAAHELFDVPRGWAFLMDRLVVDLTELPEQPDLSALGLSFATANEFSLNSCFIFPESYVY